MTNKRRISAIATVAIIALVAAVVLVSFKFGSHRDRDTPSTSSYPKVASVTGVRRPTAIERPFGRSPQFDRPPNHIATNHTPTNTPPAVSTLKGSTLDTMRGFLASLDSSVSLETLDKMTMDFLADEESSRSGKIELLVQRLVSGLTTNSVSTKYVCDLLDTLKPVEATQQLVAAFECATDPNVKIEIMEILEASGTLDSPDAPSAIMDAFTSNAQLIQAFFNKLTYSSDPEIAARALRGYCTVAPAEDAINVLEEVAQTWLQKAAAGQFPSADLPHTHLLEQILDSSIANEETQNSVIPMLPRLIAAFPREDLDLFDNFLYEVVAGADLTTTARETFRNYLESTKPEPIPDSKYYHWLEAMAAMSEDQKVSEDALYTFMAGSIRREADPMNLASAFIYGKDAVLDSLTPVEVDNYLTALKTEMGSTADQQEVDFYQTAIDRLQDLKARHNTK